MFKRVRWTLLGAVVGVGGSMWARRRVRRTVERYLPGQLGHRARQRLSIAGGDLRAAIDEGREAMTEREAELSARFADRMIAEPVRRGRVIEAGSPPTTPTPTTAPPGSGSDAPDEDQPTTLRALQPASHSSTTTQRENTARSYRRQRRR